MALASGRWARWFAWYPVRLPDGWYWFATIERRRIYDLDTAKQTWYAYWQYRRKGE